ncbi:MAG TPA: MOSC N-terminal beta barrel domain-containing protein [Steroidobacteraceae bacterium]|jgi:uncharacterized protein YcbX|nr:MOSC N-terminal beta barrel domain-containing protein [Steroidobacteraceae bacterium]
MPTATITQLNIYPIKSCAGTALGRVKLSQNGLAGDRNWMVVNDAGRFLTQRELPRLALVKPLLDGPRLRLRATGLPDLDVIANQRGDATPVIVWKDRFAAFDAGDDAAHWLSSFLQTEVRLVRFDTSVTRLSDPNWTVGMDASIAFADGFPILVISEASLADLNERLDQPLPMNRFRPNIVLRGLAAYEEDRVTELFDGKLRLRMVKPCARCSITTVEQASGEFTGAEPLQTLKKYRWSRKLRGAQFGQNAIIVSGVGGELSVDQELHFERSAGE